MRVEMIHLGPRETPELETVDAVPAVAGKGLHLIEAALARREP